jgi:hypothetical protein
MEQDRWFRVMIIGLSAFTVTLLALVLFWL